MNTRQKLTSDLYLAAFLQCQGVEPTMTLAGTQVVFSFPDSPQTQELIRSHGEGAAVSISDFVTSFRTLRADMMNFKAKARKENVYGSEYSNTH